MPTFQVRGRENGPYLITGIARYLQADGNDGATTGSVVALCRCGGSGKKPFCDGTHRKIEFQAPAIELSVEGE